MRPDRVVSDANDIDGSGRDGSVIGRKSELERETHGWKAAAIVRVYKDDKDGRGRATKEADELARHGYAVAGQSGDGGHINVGRTAARVALTAPLILVFGASRTKGTITITFQRDTRR